MSIEITDWSQFLRDESELPPDVEFRVLENLDEENMKTGRMSAHRLLLAEVSPVFRKVFFGPMKNTEDVVEIKETTVEAFKTMLNYIYIPSKSEKFSLKDITCPQALFDVLNLGERYQIPALVEEITLILQNLPITSENMMITATTAKNFAVFEGVSKMLREKCDNFLTATLKTRDDVYSFLHKTHLNFPEGDKDFLLEMMRANAKCDNCRMVMSRCRNGEAVTYGDFPAVLRQGLKVANKDKNFELRSCGFFCSKSISPLPVFPGHVIVTDTRRIISFSSNSLLVDVTCVVHNQVLVNY